MKTNRRIIDNAEKEITSANSAHNYYKVVLRHRQEYFRRPALQAVYRHWACRIRRCLSTVKGQSIELGCGCGALSHYLNLVRTDIYKHDWVDEVVDACDMPYKDGVVANLVAIDVLHHLPDVCCFLNEVNRVLIGGGRLVMLEPYISFFSYFIYRFIHHEPFDKSVSPFGLVTLVDKESGEACNEAVPTLLFVQYQKELCRRWPQLRTILLTFSDALVYPLTGGFSRRSWLPASWVEPLMKFEDALLEKTGRFLGMRMLVVMEKKTNSEIGSCS